MYQSLETYRSVPPQLHQSQLKAREWIGRLLGATNAEQSRSVVALVGLSGVGKSTLLSQLSQEFGNDIAVIPSEELHNWDPQDSGWKIIVVDMLPGQKNSALGMLQQAGLPITEFILTGMTEEESVEYAINHNRVIRPVSDIEAIARVSGGIPALVDILLSDPYLTEEQVHYTAASYIIQSLPAVQSHPNAYRMYCEFPLPDSVVNLFRQLDQNHVSTLSELLADVLPWLSRHRDAGIAEESALFIDPFAEQIYNESLVRGRRSLDPKITLFVPSLQKSAFHRVSEAIGILADPRRGMAVADFTRKTSRMLAFGAEHRKTGVFCRFRGFPDFSVSGDIALNINRSADYFEGIFTKVFRRHTPGEEGLAQLMMHSYAHSESPKNPVRCGWAMESMLQELGIWYAVRNDIVGLDYFYEPVSQRIELA